MAKEISRKFRREHRDVLVVIEDDFGVERQVYVGLLEVCPCCQRALPSGADGNVDIDAVVAEVLAGENQAGERLRKALTKAKVEVEPKGKK